MRPQPKTTQVTTSINLTTGFDSTVETDTTTGERLFGPTTTGATTIRSAITRPKRSFQQQRRRHQQRRLLPGTATTTDLDNTGQTNDNESNNDTIADTDNSTTTVIDSGNSLTGTETTTTNRKMGGHRNPRAACATPDGP